jgi:hypothetical protein
MGRNLNRQDAKCAKETQDVSPEMSFRASKLRFPSVWLGELGVLAVKQPLHSGFCHEAHPSGVTLVGIRFVAVRIVLDRLRHLGTLNAPGVIRPSLYEPAMVFRA